MTQHSSKILNLCAFFFYIIFIGFTVVSFSIPPATNTSRTIGSGILCGLTSRITYKESWIFFVHIFSCLNPTQSLQSFGLLNNCVIHPTTTRLVKYPIPLYCSCSLLHLSWADQAPHPPLLQVQPTLPQHSLHSGCPLSA